MKLYSEITSHSLFFIIELDELAGYYLYAYKNKNDIADNLHFYDDLQDTLGFAKEVALEEFGVPLDSWVRVE